MQSKPLVLGIAVLIGVVAVGFYFFAGGPTGPDAYASRAAGVGFEYPQGYVLQEHVEEQEDQTWHIVLLTDEDDDPAPPGGEGPPSITMIAFDNPQGLSAEAWVKSSAFSNFNLSDEQIASSTIGGEPAVTYHYSGLYENDAAVITTEEKIYFFNVGWLAADDQIREDFRFLLDHVVFL
jgi:predicted Zn-dependent protease